MTTFYCFDYIFDPDRSFELYYRLPEENWNEIEIKSKQKILSNSLKFTIFNNQKERK